MSGLKVSPSHQRSRRDFVSGAARAGAGALAIAVSARALGLNPAVAKVPEKITIGTLPFNTEVTVYAGATDFFKEEGLEVGYFGGVGGPAVIQALAAGSIPVGDIGVAPALVAAARNLPFLSPSLGAMSTVSHPWDRIMTPAGSSIRSVADLKGKKFALHQRGTIEDLALNALKKTHGIGPEDLQILLVPPPNQPQVLAQKQVDAAFLLPPFDTVAEQTFKAQTLINGADFIPYMGMGCFTFRSDFVEAYPEATKSLMKVWIRVCRWIDDNAVKAKAYGGHVIGIEEKLWQQVRLPYFVRNGLPIMPNVWHFYYMLLQGKVIDSTVDAKKLVDQAFLEPAKRITLPALDKLGMQKDAEALAALKGSYPLLPQPAEAYYADWERALVRG
jgi:NitT/TauT family transport system substrate-binding protein